MGRNWLRVFIGAALLTLITLSVASAQDFQHTYRISAGGIIDIRNVSGQVRVNGYDGDVIMVSGFKEGRDRDNVQIEDRSDGSHVELRARYLEPCNCDGSIMKNCDCDAHVTFQVYVPRRGNYRFEQISSVSGNVGVSDVSGRLTAKSVSGDVIVRDAEGSVNISSVSGSVRVQGTAGEVSAKSMSGDVEVTVTRLEGEGVMQFSSMSGSVRLKLPSAVDASIEMSTLTGSLKTDFPLQVETNRYRSTRRVHGQIGNGSRHLHLISYSGDVSLLQY